MLLGGCKSTEQQFVCGPKVKLIVPDNLHLSSPLSVPNVDDFLATVNKDSMQNEVLELKLIKAYVKTIHLVLEGHAVLETELTDGTRLLYRGADTDTNMAGTVSEYQSVLEKATEQAIKQAIKQALEQANSAQTCKVVV